MKRWLRSKLIAWVIVPALDDLAGDIEKSLARHAQRTGRPLQFRARP